MHSFIHIINLHHYHHHHHLYFHHRHHYHHHLYHHHYHHLHLSGVLVLPFGPRSLRIVTHRDIAQDDLSLVINAFRDVSAQEWLAFTINTDKELGEYIDT